MASAVAQTKSESSVCSKAFKTKKAVRAHKRAKHSVVDTAGTKKNESVGKNKYACNVCSTYLKTQQGVVDHGRVKHPEKQTQKCILCCDSFAIEALQQHTLDKHANIIYARIWGLDDKERKQRALKTYLDSYFQIKTIVHKDDRKASFNFVFERLRNILSLVREKELGEFVSSELRKAGSHATGLKINKADEFDFNIPLNVRVQQVIREGTVPYIFGDKLERRKAHGPSPRNMNIGRELKDTQTGQSIPEGYAAVVVDTTASATLRTLCFKDHLIAHRLQQKLYSCIKEAKSDLNGIDLNREAHGPAITMTMHPPSGHHISVDVTVVIDYKPIKVSEYGWPRAETRRVLSGELVETIVNAGCQLKPKGHEFWIVSFSNCESILLRGIDPPGECRKKCHKLLKRFFLTWRSKSRTGYTTIDSFAFKHLTFWMNETHSHPGYWEDSNLGVCFLDTLTEFQKCLKEKKLFNYFISNENILSSRNNDELDELAGEIEKEIREMKNINF